MSTIETALDEDAFVAARCGRRTTGAARALKASLDIPYRGIYTPSYIPPYRMRNSR